MHKYNKHLINCKYNEITINQLIVSFKSRAIQSTNWCQFSADPTWLSWGRLGLNFGFLVADSYWSWPAWVDFSFDLVLDEISNQLTRWSSSFPFTLLLWVSKENSRVFQVHEQINRSDILMLIWCLLLHIKEFLGTNVRVTLRKCCVMMNMGWSFVGTSFRKPLSLSYFLICTPFEPHAFWIILSINIPLKKKQRKKKKNVHKTVRCNDDLSLLNCTMYLCIIVGELKKDSFC